MESIIYKMPSVGPSLPPYFSSTVSLSDFRIGVVLGRGSSSEVREAKVNPGSNASERIAASSVAIKRVPRKLEKETTPIFIRDMTPTVHRELWAFQRLEKHPNIVHYYFPFKDRFAYYIVLENLGGSNISEVLFDDGPFPEDRALNIISQVLGALMHVHSFECAHGNVSSENIVISPPFEDSFVEEQAILIDFGHACTFPIDCTSEKRLIVNPGGTMRYNAPEIIEGRAYDPKLADMWAAGVVLYRMIDGDALFGSIDHGKLQEEILTKHITLDGSNWEHISDRTVELLQGLLEHQPHERLDAIQAYEMALDIRKKFLVEQKAALMDPFFV